MKPMERSPQPRTYQSPRMEILHFHPDDVITLSPNKNEGEWDIHV